MTRPFEIQGPDEEGNVWICSAEGDPNAWCHNLGPAEEVEEAFSQWLGERDYQENEPERPK